MTANRSLVTKWSPGDMSTKADERINYLSTDGSSVGVGPRAGAAAFAIQDAMNHFATLPTPGGATVSLTIKVALAAGVTSRFLVGDPQHGVLEALAGATVDRMAAAESLAQPGEVLISPELIAPLRNHITVSAWRGDSQGRQFAGEQALHNNTNQEALNFFTEALSLYGRSGDWLRRARWLRQLGTAHYRLGHMQESQIHFQEALDLLQEPLPATSRQLQTGLLCKLLGQIRHRLANGRFTKKAVGSDALRLIEAVELCS